VAQGWTDALRALHPGERIYTFWKYFRNAFARDAGLRIDNLLLSPPLAERLTAAGVDREVRGREHASDHAPAWIARRCGRTSKPALGLAFLEKLSSKIPDPQTQQARQIVAVMGARPAELARCHYRTEILQYIRTASGGGRRFIR
jgi:hypothetical protein